MFGFYFHIPYCIQRCHYCDFTTFEQSQILPARDYFELLKRELNYKLNLAPTKKLASIYFGGGTPSLVGSDLIVSVIEELAKKDFLIDDQTEITIEINPATVDETKLLHYLDFGINRFSVGAQTFSANHLKICGREHSFQDTLNTLDLLSKYNLNYSLDLLFALPQQSLEDLKKDLSIISSYSPKHVSPYCLTLKDNHPMNQGRPSNKIQLEMFQLIESELNQMGLEKYEISNFAKPGFESRHNQLYWQDYDYLGIGLSAHSYIKNIGPYGSRFWTTKNMHEYTQFFENPLSDSLTSETFTNNYCSTEFELLTESEALTDLCHTSLRTREGLSKNALLQKFPDRLDLVHRRSSKLLKDGLLQETPQGWGLTKTGVYLSNVVFEKFTFLPNELSS